VHENRRRPFVSTGAVTTSVRGRGCDEGTSGRRCCLGSPFGKSELSSGDR
jgi:hypothetical protein